MFSAAVLRFALLACVFSMCASCKHDKPKGGEPYAHRPKLTALAASSWLIELEVAGFGKAALAVPLGANAPRPIVIALHGSADRPEWACAALRSIAGTKSVAGELAQPIGDQANDQDWKNTWKQFFSSARSQYVSHDTLQANEWNER